MPGTGPALADLELAPGGNESVRTITFQIPPGISQAEFFDMGFAIDGDWVMKDVGAFRDLPGVCTLAQATRTT